MAVTVYRAGVGGAPASYGSTAGSLIAILDYCLVTGQSWTKTALGTNQAKYTQPGGTNGLILQVDDSAAGSAIVSGWETLTALNTGTNRFPATARYVNHAQSGTVSWRLITNGAIFHFVCQWYTGQQYLECFSFGDISSYYSGTDIYNTFIGAQTAAGNSSTGVWLAQTALWNAAVTHVAVDRAFGQVTPNPTVGLITDSARLGSSGGNTLSGNGPGYPDPVMASLWLSPLWLTETASGVRGLIPGIWMCPMRGTNPAIQDGNVFTTASGPLSGRTFEAVWSPNTNAGFFIETSNTWGGF